jgi:hypothetical protein
LAKVWREADGFETGHDEVVEQEVDERNDNVAGGDARLLGFERWMPEDPVALQDEVDRPAEDIGRQLSPPE